MKRFLYSAGLLGWFLALVSPCWAVQGQWAGFLYLTPKSTAPLSASQKTRLLDGLRDTAKNREWRYVKEGPIFRGIRVPGPEGIL